MLRETVKMALNKRNLLPEDVDLLLAGDLLNQIVASNFAARDLEIPFMGLYRACSTMAESLSLGAMLLDGDYYERVVAAACSHHYTAEGQYRFPTQQGGAKSRFRSVDSHRSRGCAAGGPVEAGQASRGHGRQGHRHRADRCQRYGQRYGCCGSSHH